MNELKKTRNNCCKATLLIEKQQITRLTLAEKLALRLHLIGCTACRIYKQQSLLICRMVQQLHLPKWNSHIKMDAASKRSMQARIEQELAKNLPY